MQDRRLLRIWLEDVNRIYIGVDSGNSASDDLDFADYLLNTAENLRTRLPPVHAGVLRQEQLLLASLKLNREQLHYGEGFFKTPE